MLTMEKLSFEDERAEEERQQRDMYTAVPNFHGTQNATKETINNPDIKISTKSSDRAKEASYKIAEYELLKLKNELLSSNDLNNINHQKLTEILQRLIN